MVERRYKTCLKIVFLIGLIAMIMTLERMLNNSPSLATTETTISISVLPAPFTMRFDPSPQERQINHQTYYSPGRILVREHRKYLLGWTIQGQVSSLTRESKAVTTYVEITPIGNSELHQIDFPAGKSLPYDHHILTQAQPGFGRGRYEIRPYYLITQPDNYLFSYTAL